MHSILKFVGAALISSLSLTGFAKTQSDSARKIVNLDSGWKFIRQDVPGAQAIKFDDSKWESVNVPHTWNSKDGQDGGDNYYRGPGWYRRNLHLDAGVAGKSLFLKFDGAALVTEVFVNGQPAGTHKGAFGAFCFDVTSLLKPGADNEIAVRVDNAKNPAVAPLGGDFTVFGGLYRDVQLLELDKLSISPLDYASSGVYLKQVQVNDKSAEIIIETLLRNANGTEKNPSLKYTVTDAKGKVVLTATGSQTVAASGTATATQNLTLENPHLWNGCNDPYLYQVKVDLLNDGKLADTVTQPLGLRYFKVDPDKGLFLNGSHYPLHGVNRHQDRRNKGWAIGPAEHKEDFDMIMEMGCTGVRLAHYQHADYFYSLCDKGGLVTWAELPLVNALGATPEFDANASEQLNELIKQNFNHPSILFWSLFNELHDGGKWLDAVPDWSLLPKLNAQAHQLDPSRLTASAACIKPNDPQNRVTDLVAFNRYPGWYYDKPDGWPKALEGMKEALPGSSIGISEYGAGANILHHEADLKQPKPGGNWHPEEWQSHIHETAYQAMEKYPWLWCTFVWNMFDFAVDVRDEGELPGLNDKGLVTQDRKTKKDSFFWYKANWSKEPFVHINSRRFTPRPSGPATVRVYSNLDKVDLVLNGKSLGEKTGTDHIFEWENVVLPEGEARVQAVALNGKKKATDACVWKCSKSAPVQLNKK
ncbi:MAG: glycoside hydrolase family 2 TIM barrel-domain containing protein [Verrucomicrobiota bacterium]